MLFIFWGCPRKYVFERCAGIQGKKAAAVQRPPQPFSATIIPCRPPCRRRARAHSSRSPDSRLVSACTAFSGLLRMAGFRRVHGLRAYSGGTVPDSDRIPYSLPFRCGRAALERSVFRRNYILRPQKSQPWEVFPSRAQLRLSSSISKTARAASSRICARLPVRCSSLL